MSEEFGVDFTNQVEHHTHYNNNSGAAHHHGHASHGKFREEKLQNYGQNGNNGNHSTRKDSYGSKPFPGTPRFPFRDEAATKPPRF